MSFSGLVLWLDQKIDPRIQNLLYSVILGLDPRIQEI